MDCLFSSGMELTPHITTCGDMSPTSDLLDASIYASSPNSLFMYDQEKMDMQCSYGGNSMCSIMDDACFGDDFELSSKYEVSQDISSLQMKEIPNQSHTSSSGWSNKDEQKDVYIKSESTSDECTPTLAELNLNFDLLEDIDSYINIEMGSKGPDLQPSISTDMEKDVKQAQEVCELSVKRCYGRNGNIRIMPGSVYQSMPKIIIKQEPADNVDGNHQKSFTQLLSSSQPSGKGLGTPTKQPLSTICEIDISDCQTLQKLLTKINNSQPVKATTPRKRFVSESIEDPCFKPSIPKRPASVSGLNSMDLKWEEIKHFLHTDESPASEETNTGAPPLSMRKERTRYDSSSSVMTSTSIEDEEESADNDKDFDDDSDSDLEGGADIKFLSSTDSLIGPKDKQHFWQYNVQSKGPKGTRVHFDMEEDPHVLNDFEDPVFDLVSSDNLSSIGVTIKHGGKARKGDGNDIVPGPKKLCQIGLQLRKINKQINDFVLVKELPSSARSRIRKEKNKLASRACRLKKKAQHEANKVKLNGLEIEHRKLLIVIRKIRKSLLDRLSNKYAVCPGQPCMMDTLQGLMMEHLGTMIAGNTVDYINSIIHKVEAGDPTGGLLIKATRSYPKELHK